MRGTSRAAGRAEAGTAAWETALGLRRRVRRPDVGFGEFYALLAELVATLAALEDLAEVLAEQLGDVAGRAAAAGVFDDSESTWRAVSVPQRFRDVVAGLDTAHRGMAGASVGASRAWAALGHLGVDPGRARQ